MAKLKKSEELELDKQTRESFKFDMLKMYFGYDYTAKCGIVVRQPTLGEIIDNGETEFYETLNIFVSNPTQYRLPLWNMGIDWCKLSDFELFCILFKTINKDIANLLFPSTDLTNYELFTEHISEEQSVPILFNKDTESIIRNNDYLEISQYLRTMFGIFPNVERAKGKATKEAIIWEDGIKVEKLKNKPSLSHLQSLISSCLNHPGFKYKKNELKEVGICEFMDSVQRLQVYENTIALLHGSMSGFCDTSKVPKDNFNFMREISHDDNKSYSQKEKDAFEKLAATS